MKYASGIGVGARCGGDRDCLQEGALWIIV
jgi:hypothetical protein